jgi:uncharacterized alpha-E superfamily protein
VNQSTQLDVDFEGTDRWLPLVVVTGQGERYLDGPGASARDDAEAVQGFLVWNEDNPSSILRSLAGARENARTIRETISLEMWEVLNGLWVWLRSRPARRLYDDDRHAFYVHLRDRSMLFHGAAATTMLHEDPFEFMRLGSALERTDQTARILDVKHESIGPTDAFEESPAEVAQWLATLRFCSGVEPFFKREDQVLAGPAVANFLLFDEAFPRSVVHNLDRVRNFIELVRPPSPSGVGNLSAGKVDEALRWLRSRSIEEVLRGDLHALLTWVVETCADLDGQIRADFFEPAARFGQRQHQRQQ